VPSVPRVLLDHVHDHLAQGDGPVVRNVAQAAQVSGVRDESLGEGDLVAPRLPGLGDHRGVGDRTGPVSVVDLIGPVKRGSVLARHDAPEPVPLHIGHVPDQAEQ
jgi:hypothetical protein